VIAFLQKLWHALTPAEEQMRLERQEAKRKSLEKFQQCAGKPKTGECAPSPLLLANLTEEERQHLSETEAGFIQAMNTLRNVSGFALDTGIAVCNEVLLVCGITSAVDGAITEVRAGGSLDTTTGMVLVITVTGEYVLKKVDQITGAFKAVIGKQQRDHILFGDYNKDAGYVLTGGLHSHKGLEDFIKMGAQNNRPYTVKNNAAFIPGVNTTEDILTQTLPNGVTRVQLPRSGYNKDIKNIKIDGFQGVKTLFPESWTNRDKLDAMDAVVTQNAALLKSETELRGTYKGVKVIVIRQPDTGVITTYYPDWDQ
jgi:hypothetical protein